MIKLAIAENAQLQIASYMSIDQGILYAKLMNVGQKKLNVIRAGISYLIENLRNTDVSLIEEGRLKLKKKIIKKEVKPEIKQGGTEIKHFETTNKELAYKLSEKGHKVKEVKGPFGDRKEKLYIFHDDEQTIKEVLK